MQTTQQFQAIENAIQTATENLQLMSFGCYNQQLNPKQKNVSVWKKTEKDLLALVKKIRKARDEFKTVFEVIQTMTQDNL